MVSFVPGLVLFIERLVREVIRDNLGNSGALFSLRWVPCHLAILTVAF